MSLKSIMFNNFSLAFRMVLTAMALTAAITSIFMIKDIGSLTRNPTLIAKQEATEEMQASLRSALEALEKNSSSILMEVVRVSPLEAIQVPMLRKDLDTVTNVVDSKIYRLQSDIERLYQFLWWCLATIAAIAFVGLGIASFMSPRRSNSAP